jgi:hypothetical protein
MLPLPDSGGKCGNFGFIHGWRIKRLVLGWHRFQGGLGCVPGLVDITFRVLVELSLALLRAEIVGGALIVALKRQGSLWSRHRLFAAHRV